MNENKTMKPVLKCHGVTRTYREGPATVEVLRGVDLEVMPGERIAIVGTSGAGKTTLLQILGALNRPTNGEVWIEDSPVTALNDRKLDDLRNRSLGFVYQSHHLLPEFSAAENVAMPLLIRGQRRRKALQAALPWLEKVGLGARAEHRPAELSGGERQRVAIARAMVGEPAMILADEPTGNLDEATGEKVLSALLDLNSASKTSLLLVTHDLSIAKRMDRTLRLHDGVLTS